MQLSCSRNVRIHSPQLDITGKQNVQNLVTEIELPHGAVNVLIRTQASMLQIHLLERGQEDQKRLMDVSVRGTPQLCQSVIPIMKAHERIVNLSSIASHFRPYSESNQARFRTPTYLGRVAKMAVEFEVRRPSNHTEVPLRPSWDFFDLLNVKNCPLPSQICLIMNAVTARGWRQMNTEVSAKKGDPSKGGLVLQRIPDVKSMYQCYGRYLSKRKSEYPDQCHADDSLPSIYAFAFRRGGSNGWLIGS